MLITSSADEYWEKECWVCKDDAEEFQRLSVSLRTAISRAEEAEAELSAIRERMDVEKLRVAIKHDSWVITSHDDPFILYQEGNMSKGKLSEYISRAVIAYLKGGE